MRVLLVEDDPMIAEAVSVALKDAAYAVDWVRDGEKAADALRYGEHQAVLLDLGLPGRGGLEVLAALREGGSSIPVIIITARDGLGERIAGLDSGADDYLVKPFSFTELVLRIRTLLRRGVTRESDVFEIADLKLDVLRRKVTREGVEIPLTNKEFMLLHLLVRRQGEALSRTQIASEVWDMNFDSDTNVVDVAIKRLRAKVDHPFEKKLIHTVRSIGYTFGDGS